MCDLWVRTVRITVLHVKEAIVKRRLVHRLGADPLGSTGEEPHGASKLDTSRCSWKKACFGLFFRCDMW